MSVILSYKRKEQHTNLPLPQVSPEMQEGNPVVFPLIDYTHSRNIDIE